MGVRRRSLLQLAAGLSAASVAGPAGAAEPRPNLVVAVADLPATLEPIRDMGNVGTRITYSCFDTLIRRDFLSAPGGNGSTLVPALAESWQRVSPQELNVTLRQGVKFHNGDELTAEDVAFTFSAERMWGPHPMIPDARNYFGVLDDVSATGRYTVRFHTKGPDVLLEQRLASWASWVVNKRAYQALGLEGFARAPVGTGPFRLRRFVSDTMAEYDAFDDYWMGRPTAASVSFRKVPEIATRLAGLVSGEFDIITNMPPDQIDMLNGYGNIEARSVVLANAHLLIYDLRGPAMGDKRVRQALSYAIDRKLLVDSLWNGRAVIPNGHNFPEYGPMYLPGHAYAFDPDKARQLLKAAGYNGQKIVYRTLPNYYTNALPAAEILLEMWKAVGINAELEVVENFTQMARAGMQIGNNSNSIRLPDPLGSLWVSWSPDAAAQLSGQWPADSAAGFNAAGRALEREVDPEKRRQLFETMLTAWEDEAPGTILYQPLETYGVKKSIRWQPYTFYYMDLRPYNLAFATS
jgi:peptide/nickel transport system substrate-binding protein